MAYYRTCLGCQLDGIHCDLRTQMARKIKGIGLTSIKWNCNEWKPKFKPGESVFIRTLSEHNCHDYDGNPPFAEFPGWVVRHTRGRRYIAFILPNVLSNSERGESVKFVAKNRGFLKIHVRWMRSREGDAVLVCPRCLEPVGITNIHGFPCCDDGRYGYADEAA